jgi:threonylcarbamoyladenosine tRNA methylthiotransferase MtaB
MRYSVVTFGCRVNQADSLKIENDLLAKGATSSSIDEADLVVVNTCTVTAAADQGARQTIRRIARTNPGVKVVVTGCYATRMPGEIAGLPNVAHVVSNSTKDGLVDLLADQLGLTTAQRFGDGDDACGSRLAPGVAGRTALTIRVQTGCEEECSYCIIPSTRGKGRSHRLTTVRGDVALGVSSGYKEIVITGVHLGSYGRDLGDAASLTALVRMLSEWPADVLFRISSLEPMDCTPEIVDLVASSPRLAPHFHLPLQHGADQILRAMRRPYTAAQYHRLADRIRTAMPHASIGSDIIVGFPGETAAHAGESLSLLRDLPLTHLHVFPYSDRPGTTATAMPGKVEGVAIRERSREVRAVGEEMTRRFRAAQVGTTRRALTVEDGSAVVTDNYLKVKLDRRHPRNEWVQVRIEQAEPLMGSTPSCQL